MLVCIRILNDLRPSSLTSSLPFSLFLLSRIASEIIYVPQPTLLSSDPCPFSSLLFSSASISSLCCIPLGWRVPLPFPDILSTGTPNCTYTCGTCARWLHGTFCFWAFVELVPLSDKRWRVLPSSFLSLFLLTSFSASFLLFLLGCAYLHTSLLEENQSQEHEYMPLCSPQPPHPKELHNKWNEKRDNWMMACWRVIDNCGFNISRQGLLLSLDSVLLFFSCRWLSDLSHEQKDGPGTPHPERKERDEAEHVDRGHALKNKRHQAVITWKTKDIRDTQKHSQRRRESG